MDEQKMSLKSPLSLASPTDIASFPRELHLNILMFLRATDLSSLQRTCRCFNNRDLVVAVVDRCAHEVYPSELTKGFDTPIVSGEVRSVAVASKKGGRKNGNGAQFCAATTTSPPAEKVYTYELLRNMEMLVVARVLSRPEPPPHERASCFYVSKSWCRAALRWLEVQEEERKEREERRRARVAAEAEARLAAANAAGGVTPRGKKKGHHKWRSPHPGSSGKKKLSRKEQRQRDRKMSDAMPPWANINNDIVCEHGSVKQCSSKSARARRRVMDKQAWKVLKRLYPESDQLEASDGYGCLLCAAEAETVKKAESDRREEERTDRRKPLGCPLVRGFYTRGSKGYPLNCMVTADVGPIKAGPACPLVPGVYCALPRSWCHRWRRYIKTGEGGAPPAPDASEVLCEAHNLPLVPPHLESFLRGETSTLLGGSNAVISAEEEVASEPVGPAAMLGVGHRLGRGPPRGVSASDAETLQALRAAGLSEAELHAQRVTMAGIERDMRCAIINDVRRQQPPSPREQKTQVVTNEQLDRENRIVVEVLTEEEVSALEKWWPRCHGGTYALRFVVVAEEGGCGGAGTEVLWSTTPCRECDPSSPSTADFVVRNRLQKKGYR